MLWAKDVEKRLSYILLILFASYQPRLIRNSNAAAFSASIFNLFCFAIFYFLWIRTLHYVPIMCITYTYFFVSESIQWRFATPSNVKRWSPFIVHFAMSDWLLVHKKKCSMWLSDDSQTPEEMKYFRIPNRVYLRMVRVSNTSV